MKKQRQPTQEEFEALLDWLHPDRNEAGKKYEAIRYRLIKFFTCRGCGEAEDLADETINRVATKVPEIAPVFQGGDPAIYFYGVAKKVNLEYMKPQRPVLQPVVPPPSEDERMYECLDSCMETLPDQNRQLVLRYYQDNKKAKIDNRKSLADEFGIAANALRIRAHRIRLLLRDCVQNCVEQPATH